MTRDYRQDFVDEVNAAAGYDVTAWLKATGYTPNPEHQRRIANALGDMAGRYFATFSEAVDWLFSDEGQQRIEQQQIGEKFAARLRDPSRATVRLPRRTTALGALTALPGGSTGTGHAPARAYDLAELDESREHVLSCSLCAGVIEPGAPLTYYADTRGGFSFYHPDCALALEEPA
jgi:hypothetical protein